ncbi:MAG: hypothetical protein AAFY22_01470 [Pseudomonadota bacterium]
MALALEAALEPAPDRRKKRRRRTFYKGEIDIGVPGGYMECVCTDLSDQGARLDLLQPAILPNRFKLRLIKSGAVKQARTVWRAEKCIGVVFEA